MHCDNLRAAAAARPIEVKKEKIATPGLSMERILAEGKKYRMALEKNKEWQPHWGSAKIKEVRHLCLKQNDTSAADTKQQYN